MAAPAPGAAWARRVSGSALLAFFVSLIVLTFLAVDFWNRYEMAATGSLTLLAVLLPLELLYLVYFAKPVWALTSSAGAAAVDRAVRSAVGPATAEPVAERKGGLRACTTVVRVSDPECSIGWWEPSGAQPPGRTTILLVGGSPDRAALSKLRAAIAEGLSRPDPPA